MTWPAAGQQVTVVVGGELEQPCIVDDVRPPRCLVLRKPVSLETEALTGTTLVLRWTTTAGRYELTGTLAGQVWDRMPLWEVDVLQDPLVFQQRAFARAADALPVQLRQADRCWEGVAVDISEAGARCSLQDGRELLVGGAVELLLSLEGRPVLLQAEVLNTQPESDQRQVVRLRFSAPGWSGDALRRRVMEQQRRARAASRR